MHKSILNVLAVFLFFNAAHGTSEDFQKLEQTVYTQNRAATFVPYKASKISKADFAVWVDKGNAQEPLKASLVGVNVNTWLENPAYFTTLKEQAKSFSISYLLDNLQANNPNIQFNAPDLVADLLNEDIYSKYLKDISNYSAKNLRFADVTNIISYTRNIHIYGASAGRLPYFGRPVEGDKRMLNLGLVDGQIDEIAVKLPDTDLFLVAMVNIVPNWLEEGWDIHQISQQELEILVYAFDRRGKLLGGGGVPMSFYSTDRKYTMEQKIVSKVWQNGTSRRFYVWPSFKISNSKDRTKGRVTNEINVPDDSHLI